MKLHKRRLYKKTCAHPRLSKLHPWSLLFKEQGAGWMIRRMLRRIDSINRLTDRLQNVLISL